MTNKITPDDTRTACAHTVVRYLPDSRKEAGRTLFTARWRCKDCGFEFFPNTRPEPFTDEIVAAWVRDAEEQIKNAERTSEGSLTVHGSHIDRMASRLIATARRSQKLKPPPGAEELAREIGKAVLESISNSYHTAQIPLDETILPLLQNFQPGVTVDVEACVEDIKKELSANITHPDSRFTEIITDNLTPTPTQTQTQEAPKENNDVY